METLKKPMTSMANLVRLSEDMSRILASIAGEYSTSENEMYVYLCFKILEFFRQEMIVM